jgi:hypothetical protein
MLLLTMDAFVFVALDCFGTITEEVFETGAVFWCTQIINQPSP